MDLQLTAKTANQQRDRRLLRGRWSRLRRARPPLRPSRTMIRLGYAIAGWGGVFAAVHFYWAAGGTALNNGGPADGGASAYVAFIAVLGVIGGLVGVAIARAATRRIPRRPLLLLTRVGAALLLLGVAIARSGWPPAPTTAGRSTPCPPPRSRSTSSPAACCTRSPPEPSNACTESPPAKAVPRPDPYYIHDRRPASGSPRRAARTPLGRRPVALVTVPLRTVGPVLARAPRR
jgi:hypothetical protein